jgi:hypothetical protein
MRTTCSPPSTPSCTFSTSPARFGRISIRGRACKFFHSTHSLTTFFTFRSVLYRSRSGQLAIMKLTIVKLANARTSHFKIFNVSAAFTPAMVIENVLAGKAAPKGWAITEVVEKGDGAWAKVCDASVASTQRDCEQRAILPYTSVPTLGQKILTAFGLTLLLQHRAPQSSTAANVPALRSRAWAGLASVARACRRSGWLCIRCEELFRVLD